MARRERERQGRHASVGGVAADGALDDLVAQFSDPWSFVRELVQNSLDAGALSIDVEVTHRDGVVAITVADDGEGMDRATIEGYLLTLFRSTKEEDLTKIGKFGIGFVSLFAIDPFEVVVDTGRDGVWHRLVFDESRAYTLYRQPEPFEGTTVSIRIRGDAAHAAQVTGKVREAAIRWCRYAEADLRVGGPGAPPTSVRAPFAVDSPVTVHHAEDGLEVVMGIAPAARAPIAWLNHGLTLWEGPSDVVPGVTFLAKARHLEHTLTRDDVLRDRHFRRAVDRLTALAGTALRDAVLDALADAAAQGDLIRAAGIAASVSPRVPWTWPWDRPVLPGVGGPLTLRAVDRSQGGVVRRWLGSELPLLMGDPSDPLAVAVAANTPVVAARPEHVAHARWAGALLGLTPTWVADRFTLVEAVDPPPWLAERFEAARAVAAAEGLKVGLHPARLHGRLAGPLAVPRGAPSGLEERDPTRAWRTPPCLCVDASHPTVAGLERVPVRDAGVLLLRAALAATGHAVAPSDALLDGARR